MQALEKSTSPTLFATFLGALDITCEDACDSNDDGMVDGLDAIDW